MDHSEWGNRGNRGNQGHAALVPLLEAPGTGHWRLTQTTYDNILQLKVSEDWGDWGEHGNLHSVQSFNLKWFQFMTEDKASWPHWLSTAFRRHCESTLFLPHVTSHLRWCKVKIEDALRMCIECIGCLTASALCTACGCHMLPYPFWSISADRSRSELSGSEMKQMKQPCHHSPGRQKVLGIPSWWSYFKLPSTVYIHLHTIHRRCNMKLVEIADLQRCGALPTRWPKCQSRVGVFTAKVRSKGWLVQLVLKSFPQEEFANTLASFDFPICRKTLWAWPIVKCPEKGMPR